jgi:hypothetical protein
MIFAMSVCFITSCLFCFNLEGIIVVEEKELMDSVDQVDEYLSSDEESPHDEK